MFAKTCFTKLLSMAGQGRKFHYSYILDIYFYIQSFTRVASR